MVDRTLPRLMAADLKTLVRGLLLASFDLFERDEGLYLELLRQRPRLDIQPALRAFEQQMQEVFRLYILRHYREFQIEHLPAAVFRFTNSAVFTILRYLSLPRPPSRESCW